MRIKIQGQPNWEQAEAYARAMREAEGDEDRQLEIADKYLAAGGPDEIEADWLSLRDVQRGRELWEAAICRDSQWASIIEAGDWLVLVCEPETGADQLIETLWRQGVLAAAGFCL
jgi:hypothetical protein